MAVDTVKAGTAKRVLVSVADRRLGTPGLDQDFADGAAAFIIGDKDVAAELIGSYTVSNELLSTINTIAKTVRVWRKLACGSRVAARPVVAVAR